MVGEISNKRSQEAIEEDVKRLQDWLDKQPHLPHDVEHRTLLSFVNGTKTLEAAKRKLDAYFSNRNRAAKLFDVVGRDVNSEYRHRSRALNMFFSSKLSPEGYMVMWITLNDCFSKAFDHPHEATRTLMMIEMGMKKWPEAVGAYLIFDCKKTPASIITMFSPTHLAACLSCYQEGYPVRLKGVFCINSPPFIEFVSTTLFKPLLKAKLYSRVKVTNEDESFLRQYISDDLIPSNYGGKDKTDVELNNDWLDLMEENNEWFKLSTQQSSDEKKRPPDSQNTYGIDGTFRKLAVD